MRAADLGARRVAVWGLGREGRAAIGFLRRRCPTLSPVLLDEAADRAPPPDGGDLCCVFGREDIARTLAGIDVIVKSPGVSLYHPLIAAARARGVAVTSLLNLWFAEKPALTTICVTGTKGKSTTASLLAHILAGLGRRTALAGNIGVPVSAIDESAADCAVIEVSSYQAADFAGHCDVAVLTSLYPEHLDWHGSAERYFRDKLNLLEHARYCVVNRESAAAAAQVLGGLPPDTVLFNDAAGLHCRDGAIFAGGERIGAVGNAYLSRPHNLSNLSAALTAARLLGLDSAAGLAAAASFRGLPHRQQELGESGGLLFVDDSISTTPESTIAALAVYAGRPITVILGGYDRGIDYDKLVAALAAGAAHAAVCLGESGARIHGALHRRPDCAAASCLVSSMSEAVAASRRLTPPGGVVLLSPAAPSYGQYRDFIERGRDFAAKAGLPQP
ncbi:MAG TPA: UDP-N-acetylmuramoyl-L-alanine--D-glutamate ligase [Stellaceae bacterium]|nr:UDP-N-acetylmuramoyl-L-alanine--D-glutamate ligase [Stellaceae bacterium]